MSSIRYYRARLYSRQARIILPAQHTDQAWHTDRWVPLAERLSALRGGVSFDSPFKEGAHRSPVSSTIEDSYRRIVQGGLLPGLLASVLSHRDVELNAVLSPCRLYFAIHITESEQGKEIRVTFNRSGVILPALIPPILSLNWQTRRILSYIGNKELKNANY